MKVGVKGVKKKKSFVNFLGSRSNVSQKTKAKIIMVLIYDNSSLI